MWTRVKRWTRGNFICGIKEVVGLMVGCGLEGARDLESKCEIYKVDELEGVGTLG